MQLTGKLCIVGDSFCNTWMAWPHKLFRLLNPVDSGAKQFCLGINGGSWWQVRDHLFNYMRDTPAFHEQCEVAIIIHPSYMRPNQYRTPTFPPPVELPFFYDNRKFDELTLAISLHYKYLHDSQFNIWAFKKWLAECETCFKPTTQIFHLFTTAEGAQIARDYNYQLNLRGRIVNTPLTEIAMRQHLGKDRTETTLLVNDFELGFKNHFSDENNIVLAHELERIITTDTTDIDISNFKF